MLKAPAKLVLVTTALALAIVGQTGCKSKSKPTVSTSNDQPAQEQTAETEAPAEEEKDLSNLAIGETVTFNDGLSVTVNSVQTGLVNYDNSLITCVNVTYANSGSSNASFNVYDWKGEDANGAQRNTAYYSEASEELNSGTLSAGGTVTGNIYFDDGVTRVMFYENMFNDSASAGWLL